jgi:hypothetical protein
MRWRLVSCGPECSSDRPGVHPSATGDHHVIEETQAHSPRRAGDRRRRAQVGWARLQLARWVVVCDRECAAVAAEHDVEHVAHRQRRTIDGPLRDHRPVAEPVPGVTDEYDNALPPRIREQRPRRAGHVGRAVQPDGITGISRTPCQPEGRHDGGRLRRPDSWPARKLFRPGLREPGQPAVLRQQARRHLQCALPRPAVPQQQGHQFRVAERLVTGGPQPLPRPLPSGNAGHRDGHRAPPGGRPAPSSAHPRNFTARYPNTCSEMITHNTPATSKRPWTSRSARRSAPQRSAKPRPGRPPAVAVLPGRRPPWPCSPGRRPPWPSSPGRPPAAGHLPARALCPPRPSAQVVRPP